MKHLLSLKDWSRQDIERVIQLAGQIKRDSNRYSDVLKNKTLLMLFQKTSTRTRLSFEAGMTQLGGHAIFIDSRTTQFSLADFQDEIRAAMRFGDILAFRANKFSDVEYAAQLNQVPVIDACSEKYHPCQALSDLLTMAEAAGGMENIKKVTWLGIENNVSNTLKLVCAKMGIDVFLAAPMVNEASVDEELNQMAETAGCVHQTLDLAEAVKDADFIHTDTWLDMEYFDQGRVKPEFRKLYDERVKLLRPFQLNAALIEKYAAKAKIMHCMPCHVGYEISRDAIDHPNSVVFDQAENKLYAQKAILLFLLEKN